MSQLIDNLTKWPSATDRVTQMLDSGSSSRGGSTDPYLRNPKYTVIISKHSTVNSPDSMLTVVGSVPKSFQIDHSTQWSAPWGAGLAGKGFAGDMMAILMGNRLIAHSASLQVWQGSSDDTNFQVEFDLIAYSDPELDVMKPLRDLMSLVVPYVKDGFLMSPGATIKPEALNQIGGAIANVVTAGIEATVEGAKAGWETFKSKPTMVAGASSAVATALQTAGGGVMKAVGDSGLTSKEAIESNMENVIQVNIGDWFTMNNVVITDVRHTLSSQLPGQTGGLMHANVTLSFRPMFALTTLDLPTLLNGRK
jgi:hypothetical protein